MKKLNVLCVYAYLTHTHSTDKVHELILSYSISQMLASHHQALLHHQVSDARPVVDICHGVFHSRLKTIFLSKSFFLQAIYALLSLMEFVFGNGSQWWW